MKFGSRVFIMFPAALLCLMTSCVSYQVPKDYIPDSKVVYLMQNTGFNPIRYPAVPADPYAFAPSPSMIAASNDKFLVDTKFDDLLKPDYMADAAFYQKALAYFQETLKLPLFLELKTQLDAVVITPPAPLPLVKGDKLQDFTNGSEYSCPIIEGAKVTVLNSGTYVIRLPDGSMFQYQPDGIYFWNDAAGKTFQEYNPISGSIIIRESDVSLSSHGTYRSYSNPKGKLEYDTSGDPQYTLYAPAQNALVTTYFTDSKRDIISCSVKSASGVRFDYFPEKKTILIVNGNQAVSIDSTFQKVHSAFDVKKHQTTDVLSVYLPQGIRLKNLDSTVLQNSDLKPIWPESYKLRQIGPFDFWYVDKDAALLEKISPKRLTEIDAQVKTLSGLDGTARRAIIIPPSLDSYRRLHSRRAGELINWYPSGFESLDHITLWPISVPRYDAPEGQDYFFEQEIYEIITHEYTHLLVAENAGLLSPIPVWLTEGLAVYVEAQCFPDAKRYWDTTFSVALGKDRLLSWDDVTVKTTGEYPISEARVHYAQSYGLVSRLIDAFGVKKVASYVRSFMIKPENGNEIDLIAVYKENYKKVFGVAWDGGKEMFAPPK